MKKPITIARMFAARCTIATIAIFALTAAADAACQNSGKFSTWVRDFKIEAAASGISAAAIGSASKQFAYDANIIARDRKQSVFSQSFLKFAGRMVAQYRLDHGAKNIKKFRSTFQRIEGDYGVPAPVITAFWGLESDYGANTGDLSTLRSLATLAYDCRRGAKFRGQLLDALRIIDNGDLSAAQMRGSWAGELGQTQFLPTEYMETAVDYDGDGRRDLLRSKPDVLASSARLMQRFGWRRGEPWLQEVRAPAEMDWEQADIDIRHPRATWRSWGVRNIDGSPIANDGLPASLLLPMGHKGPAFLAYANFHVFLEWNQSLVYSTTAAYFATRLAGAPRVSGGKGVTPLSFKQIKHLQRLLVNRGYDVGKVDGIIGKRTRSAVKDMQSKLGLPADSYPTARLLNRLAGG